MNVVDASESSCPMMENAKTKRLEIAGCLAGKRDGSMWKLFFHAALAWVLTFGLTYLFLVFLSRLG